MAERARRKLFIVGCQRSGTTWLQLLLGRHTAVSTVNETDLFSDFLGPMLRSWNAPDRSRRDKGLDQLLGRDEFLDLLRTFADEVFERFPGDHGDVLLEKTPQHALWGEEILEVLPDAHVLHLVRDPRDVTASLLDAADDWGDDWAPDNAYDAAWRWRDSVEAARSVRERTSRFRELRYEDLYASPHEELSRLLEWLELEAPDGFVEEAVSETRLSKMRDGETEAPWDLDEEPEGFFRKGGSGNWREELSRPEVRLVEHVCGDLMEETGYALSATGSMPPLRLFLYWLRDRVRWRVC